MDDRITLRGYVTLTVTPKGSRKPSRIVSGPNLVVTAGKAWAAQRMQSGSPPALMGWFEFGDSAAAVNAGQTTLTSPLSPPGRLAFTSSTISGNEITFTRDYPHTGASITVQEIGIFNAASAGTMFARFLTQLITLYSGDTFNITWVLEVG